MDDDFLNRTTGKEKKKKKWVASCGEAWLRPGDPHHANRDKAGGESGLVPPVESGPLLLWSFSQIPKIIILRRARSWDVSDRRAPRALSDRHTSGPTRSSETREVADTVTARRGFRRRSGGM